MFTGIVTDLGRVTGLEHSGDMRLSVATSWDMSRVERGASICCSGVCLSVVDRSEDRFAVDVSAETLSRTTLGRWRPGERINLERSLRLGDELGGHIVMGHVDHVGRLLCREPEGASLRLTFDAPGAAAPLIAEKGSIAIDGVSLTVNHVTDGDDRCAFGVNVIPLTARATTLGRLRSGDPVNLELDTLARYVARLDAWRHSGRARFPDRAGGRAGTEARRPWPRRRIS